MGTPPTTPPRACNVDSVRSEFNMELSLKMGRAVLLIGGPGTAKTSTILQVLAKQDAAATAFKATTNADIWQDDDFREMVKEFLKRAFSRHGAAAGAAAAGAAAGPRPGPPRRTRACRTGAAPSAAGAAARP